MTTADKVWRLSIWGLAGVGSYFAALALQGIGPRHFRGYHS
jgi:putative peptidoglycan lipid II flippase